MHPTTSASPSVDISKRNILGVKIFQYQICIGKIIGAIILIVLPQCSEEKLWVHSDQPHFPLYQQGTWRSSIWYHPQRVHLCLILDTCTVEQLCHHSHQPILNAKKMVSTLIVYIYSNLDTGKWNIYSNLTMIKPELVSPSPIFSYLLSIWKGLLTPHQGRIQNLEVNLFIST